MRIEELREKLLHPKECSDIWKLNDHIPALLAVAEAAAIGLRKGHHDTCSQALSPSHDCDCGYTARVHALIALGQVDAPGGGKEEG